MGTTLPDLIPAEQGLKPMKTIKEINAQITPRPDSSRTRIETSNYYL